MRFDPEDYAFVAHYDTRRVAGQVKNLSRQAMMRLVMVIISVVIGIVVWVIYNRIPPNAWFGATREAAIFLLVFLVVTAVVAVFEWFAAARASASVQVVVITVLMIASGLLLFAVYSVASTAADYAKSIRDLLPTLQQLPDPYDYNAVKPLLTGLDIAHIGLLIGIVVSIAAIIAAVILLIVWLSTPRSLGWVHRRVTTIALWLPPALLILCGGLIPFTRWKTNKIQFRISEVLPDTPILGTWLIWLLLAGMLVTVVTFMSVASRTAMAAILQLRMPQGNALRVDPLGMIVDDLHLGPQRITWPAINLIGGRPHGQLPGPELVIGRPGQPAWTVPFLYLDVMPGTIDSAIRAHTQDARNLDLSPMDKLY